MTRNVKVSVLLNRNERKWIGLNASRMRDTTEIRAFGATFVDPSDVAIAV